MFLADQATKFVFSKLVLTCNRGSILGILLPNITLVSVGILIFILYAYFPKKFVNQIGLGLIVGAGVGNLADRLIFGCVRDWIVVGFLPSFNLADLFLTLGTLVIVVDYLKLRQSFDVK